MSKCSSEMPLKERRVVHNKLQMLSIWGSHLSFKEVFFPLATSDWAGEILILRNRSAINTVKGAETHF